MSILRTSDQEFYPRLHCTDEDPVTGDRYAVIELAPVQFEEFYQRQSESLKQGNVLNDDDVDENVAGPCPVCGGCRRLDLHTMHKVASGIWEEDIRFRLCLTCFTAIQVISIDVPKLGDYV